MLADFHYSPSVRPKKRVPRSRRGIIAILHITPRQCALIKPLRLVVRGESCAPSRSHHPDCTGVPESFASSMTGGIPVQINRSGD